MFDSMEGSIVYIGMGQCLTAWKKVLPLWAWANVASKVYFKTIEYFEYGNMLCNKS